MRWIIWALSLPKAAPLSPDDAANWPGEWMP